MSDFSNYNAIVVGCGLTGGIAARHLAEKKNMRVLILECRNHIGGNIYDYRDENGILVQKYGPHILHTKKREIFEFVKQFGGWNKYNLTCRAEILGKQTPSPFNFQTIDDFYSHEEAARLKEHIRNAYPG